MKFSIKDFFGKCDIWSHLPKKSLMKNFIFCVVKQLTEILVSFVHNRKGVIYIWTVVDLGDGSRDIDHYLRTSLINDP